jgi:hypothetical protein
MYRRLINNKNIELINEEMISKSDSKDNKKLNLLIYSLRLFAIDENGFVSYLKTKK